MASSLKGQLELKPKKANLLGGTFEQAGHRGRSPGKAAAQPLPSDCPDRVTRWRFPPAPDRCGPEKCSLSIHKFHF